jgi:hypothetical protein
MKPLFVLVACVLLAAGSFTSSQAAPVEPRNFLSSLSYSGSEWRVRSDVGPIYLARLEGGTWRVLACFDGTKGNYVLQWKTPYAGIYAAIAPSGAFSEVVQIGERRGP